MDAFYASVEVRDQPRLRGKPVAVAWAGARSVICAASYEARRFGIHSAMPLARALRSCPDLEVVTPRMELYAEISRGLREVYAEFTEAIEPLALDECYLDLTESVPRLGPPGTLVQRMRSEIRARFDLPASAGVGPNKYIAKIASGHCKPDGQRVVRPEEVCDFLWPLPVSRIWGVGPVTERRLRERGFHTIEDVAKEDPEQLRAWFGKFGTDLYELAWGRDRRPVETEWVAKSVSAERTFERNHDDPEILLETLRSQAQRVAERLRKRRLLARSAILKLRWPDFSSETRVARLAAATSEAEPLWRALESVLRARLIEKGEAVRLIGLGAGDLCDEAAPRQLELFS